MKARGSTGPPLRGGIPSWDDQLGVGLDHVVLLHERLLGQLPVHREAAGVPPLGPHGLHLPGVEDGGERLDAVRSGGASPSRLIHAQPPHTSARTGVRSRSSGCRLCSANVLDWVTKVFLPSGP